MGKYFILLLLLLCKKIKENNDHLIGIVKNYELIDSLFSKNRLKLKQYLEKKNR